MFEIFWGRFGVHVLEVFRGVFGKLVGRLLSGNKSLYK